MPQTVVVLLRQQLARALHQRLLADGQVRGKVRVDSVALGGLQQPRLLLDSDTSTTERHSLSQPVTSFTHVAN